VSVILHGKLMSLGIIPVLWFSNMFPKQLQLMFECKSLKVRVGITLRLTVYRQSVYLDFKPLEVHDQILFFFQLNLFVHSPYLTSSLTSEWICLLWIGFAFVKCTESTYNLLLKILACALYTDPLSVQALHNRSCLSYLCYNGSFVTWKVVILTAAKFKPTDPEVPGSIPGATRFSKK
jgi:hypothetical protein